MTEEQQKEASDQTQPGNSQGWFEVDPDHNTSVYVSNLPLDTTEEDFITLMKKCGLIMKDVDTAKFKVKLYKDKDGNFKDEYDVNGQKISVERAKFQMKGEYDPSKKGKKRKAKEKRMIKKKMEKLFDWRPERLPGERPNSQKTVIIKNMFDPSEFDEDPKLIFEYKKELSGECTERCGEVKKVEIYDRHPEGVCAVVFHDFDSADKCVELLNGRWYAQRQLTASLWDGKTKYKTAETEEEAAARIEKWNKFLESEGTEKASS